MNNNLFNDVKSKVFNQSLSEDSSVSVINEQQEAELVKYSPEFSVVDNYHLDAIKTVKNVLKWAMIIFSVVTAFLCFVVCIIIFKKDLSFYQEIIPVTSSCFIDFLSATIIYVMKSLLKSKDAYFNNASKSEELSKIMALIERTSDESTKNEMLKNLTNAFCQKYSKTS